MNAQPHIIDPEVNFIYENYVDILTGEITGPPSNQILGIWADTPSQVAVQSISSGTLVSGTVSAFQHDFIQESDGTQTNFGAQNAPILLLDVLAQENDRQAFVLLAEGIIWSSHQPDELLHAIDLALNLELGSLAIALARRGEELFPRSGRVQQAAQVLAPPVVRTEPGREMMGLEDSKIWLEEHASEYRGQWVAVRDGNLLKSATSLKALRQVIGDGEEAARTLVSKIL